MSFFQNTTDASNVYRPSTAADNNSIAGSAVPGNLADIMRNGTVFRVTFIAPKVYHHTDLLPTSIQTDTFGTM